MQGIQLRLRLRANLGGPRRLVMLLDADNWCPVARKARPFDRLLVRMRAASLDAELAAGASPDGSVALALRAQMLVAQSQRRALARNADRIVAVAMGAPAAGRLRVRICGYRVRACSAEFDQIIRRLLAPGPVSARGVARVRVLLADATGPLYHPASNDDLRSQVLAAADALTAG